MPPDAPGLPEVCVVYIQRTTVEGVREVLLGRKKTGLGQGHFVAPGGKLEVGESPVDAAIREVHEEVGLVIASDSLVAIGELTYPFPHRTEWSQKSWAFLADDPGGDPVESDELAPMWVPVDALPLDEMWDDAKYWLPEALSGAYVQATFVFGPDGRSVESSDHDAFDAN